jgi:hypothetical protein
VKISGSEAVGYPGNSRGEAIGVYIILVVITYKK